MSATILEVPSQKEREDLETHVQVCHLRYLSINSVMKRIERLLWMIAAIMLAGGVSSSLALWYMLPKIVLS